MNVVVRPLATIPYGSGSYSLNLRAGEASRLGGQTNGDRGSVMFDRNSDRL